MASTDTVQLKIKSPSAAITDLLLTCKADYSIARVKILVSEQFPSFPAPHTQKLVYSGKILGDQDRLTDILRWEDECSVFTFHLVCSLPAQASTTTTTNTTQKTPESNPSPSQQPVAAADNDSSVANMMANFSAQYTATMSNMPSMPSEQEMATMQSLYNQYLSLYMEYLQSGPDQYLQHVNPPPFRPPQPQPNHDNPPVVEGDGAPAGPGVGGLVMNAGGAAGAVGQEEVGGGNRDLLDWVYVMTRVLLLFSVIYFHSSFVRLAFVTGLGFLVYMYQNRRLAGRAQGPPREDNRVIQEQDQRVNQEQEVNQEREMNEGSEEGDEGVTGENVPEEEQEEPKPSRMAVLMTFFTTLITSIIPDQNQVV